MAGESRSDITLEVAVGKAAAPAATTGLAVTNAADPTGPNNTDSEFTPVRMIDLAIAMQHAGTFALGTASTFTINVENVGSTPTIAGTRVVDTLPAGLTYNGATGAGWSCTPSGQLVVCGHSAPLGAGDQASPLTLSVTPQSSAASQVLTNTANVAGQGDADIANNNVADQVTIGAAPAQQQVQGQTAAKCKPKKPKKGKKGKKCKRKKPKKK
jgi:uncharacterized repeat protein (TIGR01451 family)